jgi:hypothetical protein
MQERHFVVIPVKYQELKFFQWKRDKEYNESFSTIKFLMFSN